MDDRIQELMEVIKELRKENEDLRNENESLWFMLDEIRASDVDEHAETLNKALEEIKLEFLMKNMKPVDA